MLERLMYFVVMNGYRILVTRLATIFFRITQYTLITRMHSHHYEHMYVNPTHMSTPKD
jgi:hypothetical protein